MPVTPKYMLLQPYSCASTSAISSAGTMQTSSFFLATPTCNHSYVYFRYLFHCSYLINTLSIPHLFIYLQLCFMSYSRIFPIWDRGQHYGGRKLRETDGNPQSFARVSLCSPPVYLIRTRITCHVHVHAVGLWEIPTERFADQAKIHCR